MRRLSEKQAKEKNIPWLEQMSTILGALPKKEHFKRSYVSASSVHQVKTAQTFIKAMLVLCGEAEKVIKELMPEQYDAS